MSIFRFGSCRAASCRAASCQDPSCRAGGCRAGAGRVRVGGRRAGARGVAALLLALALLTAGCASNGRDATVESAPVVRVRLLADVDQITLASPAQPTLAVGDNGPVRPLGLPANTPVVVTRARDGNWQIGSARVQGPFLRLTPATDGELTINGLAYRGSYRLLPGATAGKFDVINDLDVERYLKGVLAKEMLPDWHPEAFKAQAVIARTYALFEINSNPPGRSWDLFPDERSQVYGGIAAETAKSVAAVDATRGQVVAYGPAGKERIIHAYFSSCCGGKGQSAIDVFGDGDVPPLAAKDVGRQCAASPRFAWPEVTLGKADFARRLRTWGERGGRPEARIEGVKALEISATNAVGRPRRFLITDTTGQQYSLNAEDLRRAINTDPQDGPTVLSGYFTPVDAGDAVRLTDGHGWGHGVGMCQWCTQTRAAAGTDYGRIVVDAFPGATLMAVPY